MRMTITSLVTVNRSKVRCCFMADLCIHGPLSVPGVGVRPQGTAAGSRCWDRQHPAHWHRTAPRRSLPSPAQSAAAGSSAGGAARCASASRYSAAGCGPPVAPSGPVSAAALPAASPRSMPRRTRTDRAVFPFRFASMLCGKAASWTATASADPPETPPENGSPACDLLRPLPAPCRFPVPRWPTPPAGPGSGGSSPEPPVDRCRTAAHAADQ